MGTWGRFVMGLAVALGLVACGRVQNIRGFERYVHRFEEVSAQYGNPQRVGSITIDFDDEKLIDLGQCETGGFLSTPHIRLNQAKWEYLSETQREILLFHELGHCVLNRLHRTDLNRDGTPASIMYPTVLASAVYDRYQDYYLRELFARR